MKLKAYFLDAPINVPGLAQGQMVGSFILKVISTVFIFLSGALGGSSEANRGSFIRKKLYPLHLFFFDCYGYARGFSGAVQGQRYVHGIYFSLNTGGINGALD